MVRRPRVSLLEPIIAVYFLLIHLISPSFLPLGLLWFIVAVFLYALPPRLLTTLVERLSRSSLLLVCSLTYNTEPYLALAVLARDVLCSTVGLIRFVLHNIRRGSARSWRMQMVPITIKSVSWGHDSFPSLK